MELVTGEKRKQKNKMKKKTKIIIGILIAAVIAAAGITWYVMNQKNQKTGNSSAEVVAWDVDIEEEEPSEETAVCPNKVDFRELFLLAVATSIDALAVGVTFSIMPDVNIFLSILLIGSITFLFALAGVKIGNLFGDRFEKQTGILGGCILLAIGVKILLEGLGIIG